MERRKQEIIKLIEKYYNENTFLQREPIDIIINRALNMFLKTDFTLEEIDNKLQDAVSKEKQELEENQKELDNMLNTIEKDNNNSTSSKGNTNNLVKSNNHNILNTEDGYTTRYTVLFVSLIVIVLVVTCFVYIR